MSQQTNDISNLSIVHSGLARICGQWQGVTRTWFEPGQLADAKIVSVKPDLGVAILNVGVDSGAKPGMPFAVYRGDRPIANVLVTDVRQTLSGAIVRELFSAADPIQVGDIGRVDTNHSN